MRNGACFLALVLSGSLMGCSLIRDFGRFEGDAGAGDAAAADAGFDGGSDAGFDGGSDAGFDAGSDAGPGPGELCSGATCAEGSECIDGVCFQTCTSTAGCTAIPGTVCEDRSDFPASYCLCEPVTQTGCPRDQACYFDLGPGTELHGFCAPAGSLLRGQDCSADDECMPGLTCAGSPMVCIDLCRIGQAADCDGTCDPINPMPYGDERYGRCI